jgi:hypothetical protein
MNDIRTKVAYLQGLAEGLDLDATTAEGRVITSMLDVVGELAEQVSDIAGAQDELAEYVEDIDYDLGTLEESVLGDEDDEGEELIFVPEDTVHDEENGVQILSCPQCGETLAASAGEIEEGIDEHCPACGCSFFDDERVHGRV